MPPNRSSLYEAAGLTAINPIRSPGMERSLEYEVARIVSL